MTTFRVKVRTLARTFRFDAIAQCSLDLYLALGERFGFLSNISVTRKVQQPRRHLVHVRHSMPDPFAGLRGHAYVQARQLAKPVKRINNSLPAANDALTDAKYWENRRFEVTEIVQIFPDPPTKPPEAP